MMAFSVIFDRECIRIVLKNIHYSTKRGNTSKLRNIQNMKLGEKLLQTKNQESI